MEQIELQKEIGTLEPEKKEVLKPIKVKIVKVDLRPTKHGSIVQCEVKYPDREEPIHVSSLAYLKDKKVVNGGLWYSLDKSENIQMDSALAVFMSSLGVKTLGDLIGKEVDTELDEKEWLCFKAY